MPLLSGPPRGADFFLERCRKCPAHFSTVDGRRITGTNNETRNAAGAQGCFDYGTRFYLVAFSYGKKFCYFLSAKKVTQRRHKGRGSSDSPPPLDPTLLKRPRVFPSRTLPGITESYSFSNTGILYRLRGVAVCLPQGRSVELYFCKTVFVNRMSEPHGIYPTESVNLRREMAQEIFRPYGTSFPDSPEGVRGRKSLGRFKGVGLREGGELELPLPVRLLCSTFFAERKLKTISSMKTGKS